MIDGALAEQDGVAAEVRRKAKVKDWHAIDARYYAGLVTSPSGLLVVDEAEYYEAERREREAAMTPAERVWRQETAPLLTAVEDAEAAEYYEPARIIQAKAAVEQAIKAWRAKYPEAARERDRKKLLADAEHEDQLAAGALTYDADGWLDQSAQQARHDEHRAKAAAIRAKAQE